jgi:NADPH-dependent glutamate synthase beta subunit-like oxidoreductase
MYRRTGDDMPATHLPEEIEAALHEGVRIHTLVNPVAIIGDEHVKGVKLQRQRLVEFDNSARRKPSPLGETHTVNVDYIIRAIGRTPDLSWMTFGEIETSRARTFVVTDGYGTNRPGVFAAGDAVSGPATIIQAIAQGNLVAVAVDEWVRTGKIVKPQLEESRHDMGQMFDLQAYVDARRPQVPRLPVEQRERNMREVETGLSEKAACEEAKRCLRCDLEWLEVMGLDKPVSQPADAAE